MSVARESSSVKKRQLCQEAKRCHSKEETQTQPLRSEPAKRPRGYPSTEHIPYDAEKRTVVLERLARRDDQVDTRKYDSRSKVLVFKTQ